VYLSVWPLTGISATADGNTHRGQSLHDGRAVHCVGFSTVGGNLKVSKWRGKNGTFCTIYVPRRPTGMVVAMCCKHETTEACRTPPRFSGLVYSGAPTVAGSRACIERYYYYYDYANDMTTSFDTPSSR